MTMMYCKLFKVIENMTLMKLIIFLKFQPRREKVGDRNVERCGCYYGLLKGNFLGSIFAPTIY